MSCNLKIQPICTGYRFHQEISSNAQQCQWANPLVCCGKAGDAHLCVLPPPRSALALLQWSHSSKPGHGVRTTNKDPAMPLKMYGMSNCWFSILASLLSRLQRGWTMLRLSAGRSESTRLAQAQGSGRKEVAVVDADVVFSPHFHIFFFLPQPAILNWYGWEGMGCCVNLQCDQLTKIRWIFLLPSSPEELWQLFQDRCWPVFLKQQRAGTFFCACRMFSED